MSAASLVVLALEVASGCSEGVTRHNQTKNGKKSTEHLVGDYPITPKVEVKFSRFLGVQNALRLLRPSSRRRVYSHCNCARCSCLLSSAYEREEGCRFHSEIIARETYPHPRN